MKIKFIIIGIVTLILVGIVLMVTTLVSKDEKQDAFTDLPSEVTDGVRPEPPAVNTASALLSKDGRRVIVRDFTSDADTYEFTPTTVVIGSQEGTEGVLYKIFYFPEDGSVNVSLLSAPFEFSRELASQELQVSLGLTESQLCTFDIWVSTPNTVSELYSGQNLGLSFCPGSVSLE